MSTLGVDLSKILSAPPPPPPAQTLISPHAAKGHRPNPQTLLPRPAAPQYVYSNPETQEATPASRSLSTSPHPPATRANALPPLPPHAPPSATKTPSSSSSSSSQAAAARRQSNGPYSRPTSPPATRLAPVPDIEHANSTSLLSLDDEVERNGKSSSASHEHHQHRQELGEELEGRGSAVRRASGSISSGEMRPLEARQGSGFLDVLAAPALKWAGLKRKLRYPVPECLGRENDFCSYLTMYEQEQESAEPNANATPGPMAVGKSKRRYVAVMKDKAYMLARADSAVASVILHLPECRIEASPPCVTSPPPNLFAVYMPPGGTSSGGGDADSGTGGTQSPPGSSPLSRGGSTTNLSSTKGRYFLCVAGNEVEKNKWVAALERGKTGQEYSGPKEEEPESAATRLVLRTSSWGSVNSEEE
ncbi:hypothetical protein HDU86_006974 [Geranomyces michiganensis]|nr:hypothetical protein HDU86_006974 [Geranomyces michiganensis]